tara:strand:- start:45 stop:335 length:291 start_codon:yes stop_codon:yes gene_type:complete
VFVQISFFVGLSHTGDHEFPSITPSPTNFMMAKSNKPRSSSTFASDADLPVRQCAIAGMCAAVASVLGKIAVDGGGILNSVYIYIYIYIQLEFPSS